LICLHLCRKKTKMKNIILFISIALASGLLFTNLYTSIVDARSWGADLPNSIGVARQYFKVTNPGDFFRIFSPINQILAILALILFWKATPSVRLYLGIAALLYILCDVLTFAYFYPRNDFMFRDALLTDADALRKTWNEWTTMNWLRTFMLLAGLSLSFFSLNRVYQQSIITKPSPSRIAEPAIL
jgi:hypothetical protein